MNLGITISYIVGGILLISILTLNNTVMQSSYQHTVDITTDTRVDNLRQLISHDMNYLAFGENSKILNFSNSHLRFKATYRGKNREFQWKLQNSGFGKTSNPNDKSLMRVGPMDDAPVNVQSKYPVVRFHVQAFSDKKGTVKTSSKDEVRSILVEIIVESAEPVGEDPQGSPIYRQSGWKKLFLPDNIMI